MSTAKKRRSTKTSINATANTQDLRNNTDDKKTVPKSLKRKISKTTSAVVLPAQSSIVGKESDAVERTACDNVLLTTQTASERLLATFFNQPCCDLAKNLLGKNLVRISEGTGIRMSGKIVETESYVGIEDKAAHSFNGRRTSRNEAMFMAAGTAYVYNIYGIYTCINISSKEEGAAVLIRALEPLEGHSLMRQARCITGKKAEKVHTLCNGPSKLTKALGIVKDNGDQVDLSTCSYLWLEDGPSIPDTDIVSCSRIGIANYAEEWTSKPLRFYIRGNTSVSVRDKTAEAAATITESV